MDVNADPGSERALRGQILVMFALLLVVLLAMAGLGVDVSRARLAAETVQQAADAGADAGVAFLPGNTDLAAQQAVQVSTENNVSCNPNPTTAVTNTTVLGPGNERYVYTCNSGTQITVDAYATSDKLEETIQTQVPSLLLGVVHRSFFTVVRTADATYQDPILMGAPDPMLGYAPYVTHAFDYTCSTVDKTNGCTGNYGSTYVNTTARSQGFWLEIKGPYDGLEHGDAFSPYFENHRIDQILDAAGHTDGTITDPCQKVNNQCVDSYGSVVTLNPYYNYENISAKTGLTGYSFLFTIPGTPSGHTPKNVELKVLDPLDECYYDPRQPGGSGDMVGGTYYNWGTANTITGAGGATEGNDQFDQCGAPGSDVSNASVTSVNYSGNSIPNWSSDYPTSLSFELYKPVYSLSSNRVPAPAGVTATGTYTMTLANSAETVSGATLLSNTYGIQPLVLGPEFQTTCNNGTGGVTACSTAHPTCTGLNAQAQVTFCTPYHQYQWLNLASVANGSSSPAYVMLVINSVVNQGNFTGALSATNPYVGTYGTGGNVFSLGVCAQDSSFGHEGNPTDPAAWMAGQDTYTGYNGVGTGAGGTTDGCQDPNVTAGYATGYMVNALQGMCIMSEVSGAAGSSAYIPLGKIPNQFANGTVRVGLYDAGDVNGTLELGLLAPQDGGMAHNTGDPWAAVPANWTTAPITNTVSEPFQLDIAAPTGSNYSPIGNSRDLNSAFWPQTQPAGDYNAADHPWFDGPQYPSGGPTTSMVSATPGSSSFSNGTWLDFNLALPASYTTQTSTYGSSWWKMNYYTGAGSSGGTDCTTWWMSSNPSPIHLTNH